jgi:DNA-binding transcriptional MocR family regulator
MDTIWVPTLADGSGPKYLSLARALRDDIQAGRLAEGVQLPPVRDLAWALKVTPGTVSRAYQVATQEGLLQATVGRGTFVAATAPRLGPVVPVAERDNRPVAGRLDLRSPRLPDVGQTEEIANALRKTAMKIDAHWLDYPSQTAEYPLRAAVCDWVAGRVLGSVQPQDVVLTHGGQSSLGLALLCCLRGDRPVVLTEDLCYPGFRYSARLLRAEVHGVELDAEGIRPDALEAACRRHAAQVLCLTPEAQNPTTARMSLARRHEIVSIARRYNLQIVEDECYAPRDTDTPALRALAPERTWFVGSWSKSVSAALRFGFVICPKERGETGRLAAQQSYFALSQAVSSLCLQLFETGAAAQIRARVLAEFVARSEMAANRLGGFDMRWQPGLPFVWIDLPQGWRASTFASRAEEADVLIRSADQYAMVTGRAPQSVRITLPGDVTRERLDQGLTALAGLLAAPPSDMGV